jgi:uncharacterized membrane-anchored protein
VTPSTLLVLLLAAVVLSITWLRRRRRRGRVSKRGYGVQLAALVAVIVIVVGALLFDLVTHLPAPH